MSLLGNHLFNFGSTLTMAAPIEEQQQPEKQEVSKYFDEIDNAEDDGRDLLSLKLLKTTKQFSTQYSAKNDISRPKSHQLLQMVEPPPHNNQ